MRKSKYIVAFILLVSVAFFMLGLTYPIMSTKKQVLGLVLNYREIRLFDSVSLFYNGKEYLLGTIIFLFTIILPILKYLEIINRIFVFIRFPRRIDHILHLLDKWSMLDVFLIALLLLNFKMNSTIIVMQIKVGTLFLAVSIISRMICTTLIEYFHRRSRPVL